MAHTLRVFVGLVGAVLAVEAWAQDGTPDPSFAGGVPKTWGYPGSSEPFVKPGGAVIDAQGRVIVVGVRGRSWSWVGDSFGRVLVIARLREDGEFDPSFGENGRRIYPSWRDAPSLVTDVKLDSRERIVIAGTLGGEAMVARLLADGKFDATFGDRGVAQSVFGGVADDGNRVERVVIGADDSVLAVGRRHAIATEPPYNPIALPFVWKLTSLGQTDAQFANGGAWYPTVDAEIRGTLLDVAADGESGWIAVGTLTADGDYGGHATAVKLTSTGSLDPDFGQSGFARFPLQEWGSQFSSVARAPDGSYRAAGAGTAFKSMYAAVLALDRAGARQTSFGISGEAWLFPLIFIAIETADPVDLVMRSDGSMLAAGPRILYGTPVAVATSVHVNRVNADGTQDYSGYGASGMATLSFGASPFPYTNDWSHLVARRGRAIAAGAIYLGDRADFAVVALRDRYLFADGFE